MTEKGSLTGLQREKWHTIFVFTAQVSFIDVKENVFKLGEYFVKFLDTYYGIMKYYQIVSKRYQTYYIPVLMYGCETWIMRQKDERSHAAEMRFARSMVRNMRRDKFRIETCTRCGPSWQAAGGYSSSGRQERDSVTW